MTGNLTKGSPLKLIVLFTLPLLIGNVFQQLYNMADSIIVGKTIGKEALAAVGATGSVVFLVMGIIQGLTSGFAVITAQHFGGNDLQSVRKSVAASILLSAISGVILTIVSTLCARPLLQLMQTPNDIMGGASLYTIIIFAGTLPLIFYNMFSNVLRSFGDSRTPLVFLIIASLVNIGLDFLFILVFKMGVEGAALATVIAQGISAVACLFYMLSKYKDLMPKRSDWKLTLQSAVKHIKVGLPMSFQFVIIAVGIMVLQSAINKMGTNYVAAFAASSKIDQLATQLLVSIGAAMATYTAQNYGAGEFGRIKKGLLMGFFLSMGFSLFGFILMFFFGSSLCLLFLDSSESIVIGAAATYLKIASAFYPILSCIFLFRNSIQGMGNGIAPVISGAFELVMRVVGAFVFADIFGFTGLCFAAPLAWVVGAAVLIPAYFIILKRHRLRAEAARRAAEQGEEDNASAM